MNDGWRGGIQRCSCTWVTMIADATATIAAPKRYVEAGPYADQIQPAATGPRRMPLSIATTKMPCVRPWYCGGVTFDISVRIGGNVIEKPSDERSMLATIGQ